jgi:hypothetical protein
VIISSDLFKKIHSANHNDAKVLLDFLPFAMVKFLFEWVKEALGKEL